MDKLRVTGVPDDRKQQSATPADAAIVILETRRIQQARQRADCLRPRPQRTLRARAHALTALRAAIEGDVEDWNSRMV